MFIEQVKKYIKDVLPTFNQIPEDRKQILTKISQYILQCLKENKTPQLIYVCTHNSRRSHFGQVWGKVAAEYYDVPVETYSAGTEATAMHLNTVAALERAGFVITKQSNENNALYHVKYDTDAAPLSCFSKAYHHDSIPKENLCAVMTCDDANDHCPVIPGTALRVPCTYEDPKKFDGTPLQDQKYDERCLQIARENLYLFSLIHSK